MSDHDLFLFLRGLQGAANGQDSWSFFKDAQDFGRLDAGSRAGFTSSRPPPRWTSIFHFSYFCTMCLKKNLNAPRPSEHPPVRGGKCQNV